MASPGRDPARLGKTQSTQLLVGSRGSRATCIVCYLQSSGRELRDYLHPLAHSPKLPKEGVKVSATAHFPYPHRYLLFGHSQLLGTQNCITCPIAMLSLRLCCSSAPVLVPFPENPGLPSLMPVSFVIWLCSAPRGFCPCSLCVAPHRVISVYILILLITA